MRIEEWLPWVLQTSDPLFPTGAYSHSFGLEEIVRLGVVRDEETLWAFIKEEIIPENIHIDLPHLRLAHAAAVEGDLEELCVINAAVDAMKIPIERRNASTALGRRRAGLLCSLAGNDLATGLVSRCEAGDTFAHHVVVWAIGLQEAPLEAALAGWFYQSVAGSCSAALKLIRIGQDGCQRVLHRAVEQAPAVIAASLEVTPEEIGWFNPVLEIASMRHEHAWERLFIS